MPSLPNTQHYKVRVNGKVEQSRDRSSALPQKLGDVAIEKGAFESRSTMFANNLLLHSDYMLEENKYRLCGGSG